VNRPSGASSTWDPNGAPILAMASRSHAESLAEGLFNFNALICIGVI
jgi:hypothetical protein